MNVKLILCFCIIAFCLQPRVFPAMAITTDELADICQVMEYSIRDISLDYEWYNIPPWTFEDAEEEMGMEMLISKDGRQRFKLYAAGLLSKRDPNDPNSLLPDRILLEQSTTLMNKKGNTWDSIVKESYDGKIAKRLQFSGWPRKIRTGSISHRKQLMLPMNLTPFGFSVLRLSYDKVTNNVPLSVILRHKEMVSLDNTVEQVNDFNAIRVDLLQESTKQVCIRIYFSVDHGYTPVRYEYMRGGKPDLTFEIHSLEQVAEGLWFPSSGLISSPSDKRVDGFQIIGKIAVNQGFTEKDFDIEFPPGTEVQDDIKGVKYIVKSK